MPRIFDNIDSDFLPVLRDTIDVSDRSDFCVGYFNLRGWKAIDDLVEKWPGGEGHQARIMVGMQRMPEDEVRSLFSVVSTGDKIDNQTALRMRKRLAEDFRNQLTLGIPTASDEAGLRRLADQIRKKQVVVKLFLRHSLHAKLYLCFRQDRLNPIIGYLGSSNLTFSGLSHQGELNVDVMDHDAGTKLSKWFNDRWADRFCIDISEDLLAIINESWAREDLVSPYHIYIKMAYHLAQEARAGLAEFRIPREFGNKLFDFQTAAVKIAAHHLNKRGGVLIGDVVGLGKTLMATALAKVFQDDHATETLIICPKNLEKMWQKYVEDYRLLARVLPISTAPNALPDMRRFRVVIIDESHNLRNRAGKRYRAIQEYIQENESKCILLSATPYNKTYEDLANQLRLFIPEEADLGIRPEALLREIGETEFIRRHQCPVRSLSAFEKSHLIDDWRELMRLYMVRRTRSFIKDNYAELDPVVGRKCLRFEDGTLSFFPDRIPKTVKFKIDDKNPDDQYARLYSDGVVKIINGLLLPRYGLGNYIHASPHTPPSTNEAQQIQDLSRAGHRLKGFCRTNLFKRLESSGESFRLSIERHILRNFVFLHALDNDLAVPVGTQNPDYLDSLQSDDDVEAIDSSAELAGMDDEEESVPKATIPSRLESESDFQKAAAVVYELYATRFKRRFSWLRHEIFIKSLRKDILADSNALMRIHSLCHEWVPALDAKLVALVKLISKTHPTEKVLIFSQFADTVDYLAREITNAGVDNVAGVTGDTDDPTGVAWRFSPESNQKSADISDEIRILVATDVLSEGQNLQDASIIVNFDLPWAIIRLIQRAGRVDRIGQKADKILCYSFIPADGVERLIKLRKRVRQRLNENAEVVGTDEMFFEDEAETKLVELYNEKSGIMDGDADSEVDLASYAYQIWKNATDQDPALAAAIPNLPSVVFSTKSYTPKPHRQAGVMVYLKTPEGNDALAWVGKDGSNVTESQFEILKAAECLPSTPAIPRCSNHHELVAAGVKAVLSEEKNAGGQLGRPSGARFRTYERLKRYADSVKGTLFETPELVRVIEDIYRYPLRQAAVDTLNRQIRSGMSDERLAELVIALRDEDRLCIIHEEERHAEPQIICSLGLSDTTL